MHSKTSLTILFLHLKKLYNYGKKHNFNIYGSLVSSQPMICSQVNKPRHMTHEQLVLIGNQMIHTCNHYYLNYDINNSLWCDEMSKFSYLPADKTWHRFNNAWQMKCCHLFHHRVVRKSKCSGGITEFVRIQVHVSIDHSLNQLYMCTLLVLENFHIYLHLGV